MSKKRIEPGWRYTLAQLVLRLLFGRKHHFISPWKMAGVGAAVVFVSPDGKRVLIQQRAGNIEGAGLWGTFGGYVQLEDNEDPAQGMAREIFEETGLRVKPESFFNPDNVNIIHNQVKIEMWQHTTIAVTYFRTVEDTFDTRLTTTEEVSAYRWVNREQLDEMWKNHELSGAKNDHYLGLRLALEAAPLRGFPPIQLV